MIEDDIWEPGQDARKERPTLGLPASGDRIGPIDLISETVDLAMTDPKGFLLAGAVPWFALLGPILLAIPAIMVTVFVLTVSGFPPEMFGLVVLGWLFGGLLVGASLFTPLQASLWRAMWRRIEHAEPLGFRSGFEDPWTRLGSVVGVAVVVAIFVFIALPFCYVPAVVIAMATQFAYPAVAVHGVPVMDAIRGSVEFAREEPLWCGGVWLIATVMVTLMNQVLFIGGAIGLPFYAAYTLLAYRSAFGSGPPGPQGEKAVTP